MDNIARLQAFNSALENASEAINKDYDLYIKGIKEILEELKKPESTKIDLWTIICCGRSDRDALNELNNLIPYDVAGTEKKDFPIVIDPKNNNHVVKVLSYCQRDMRDTVAVWFALTSTDFNEVEIEGCRGPKSAPCRCKDFSILDDNMNATLMFPFRKRFWCNHDYQWQTLYTKMIDIYNYPQYVPIDVYRCVKCGDIKRMKFN